MRARLVVWFGSALLVGCASSAPPASVPEPRKEGPEATCGGATCEECLREAGCAFHRTSRLCLTSEQAEICSGESCAAAASECSAAK